MNEMTYLQVVIPLRCKRKLKKLAEEKRKSMSSLVREMIEKEVSKNE